MQPAHHTRKHAGARAQFPSSPALTANRSSASTIAREGIGRFPSRDAWPRFDASRLLMLLILRPGTRHAEIFAFVACVRRPNVRDGNVFAASCFRQNAAASGPRHRQRNAPMNWDAPSVASRLGLRRGFGIFSPPAPRGFFVGPGHHLRRRGSSTIDGRHLCRPSSSREELRSSDRPLEDRRSNRRHCLTTQRACPAGGSRGE